MIYHNLKFKIET